MITAKINVNNIDKNRLYKGEKGTYLNCIFIETPDSEYSDYMIVQEVSKEEREAGERGPIIGNAKIFTRSAEDAKLTEKEKSDLPF